ncbi:MAG: NADPH:quinone oxidoreductase family protein [Solirubrobacteraceae bacterium]|nr:NADPH:quinone oxidoreductase family protein [Solirubrobacteraceae bacterium]
MRALRVVTEDGPSAVELHDVPEPTGELIVAVRAAAVAFPDVLMTRGKYQIRQNLPFTLGWEAAGDVIRAPAGGPFAVGDRVMTLSFGAHAEQVVAYPEATFALPDALTYEEGAAFPLNYLTALAALERRGRLVPGERVLVHGAAGGVGTATIQVGKALGAHVIASVSTEDKAQVAWAAGADEVVVGDDFRAGLSGPVHLIIDSVGGTERFKESLRSLVPEGRLVVVGFAGGEIPEVRVNRLLIGNVDVIGCSFNILATEASGLADAMARLTELVGTGALRPVIGSTYPLEQGAEGLREIDERRATGKVILTV